MSTVSIPVSPDSLLGSESVTERYAVLLSDTLGYTVNVEPLDTETFPEQAAKRKLEDQGKPYLQLAWTARETAGLTFGHPDGYLRNKTYAFELACYLLITALESANSEFGNLLEEIADRIESNRHLCGGGQDTLPPTISEKSVRRDPNQNFRYHYAIIRFSARLTDRLKRVTLDA